MWCSRCVRVEGGVLERFLPQLPCMQPPAPTSATAPSITRAHMLRGCVRTTLRQLLSGFEALQGLIWARWGHCERVQLPVLRWCELRPLVAELPSRFNTRGGVDVALETPYR
jgi:hypothetical protein